MSKHLSVFLLGLITGSVLGEDFKTTDGRDYKNVTVSRVEPDGVVLSSSSGISKVYFTELPKEVQERFHYDSAKAATYSAVENARQEALRRQQQEATRQAAEMKAKNDRYAVEQERDHRAGKYQQNALLALQARYQELQQQEDDLLVRIGDAERPGSWGLAGKRKYYVPNPSANLLPLLRSHLQDVRHDKNQVREQIERTQR